LGYCFVYIDEELNCLIGVLATTVLFLVGIIVGNPFREKKSFLTRMFAEVILGAIYGLMFL